MKKNILEDAKRKVEAKKREVEKTQIVSKSKMSKAEKAKRPECGPSGKITTYPPAPPRPPRTHTPGGGRGPSRERYSARRACPP